MHSAFSFSVHLCATVNSIAMNPDLQRLWYVLLRILPLIVYLNTALDGVTPVLV